MTWEKRKGKSWLRGTEKAINHNWGPCSTAIQLSRSQEAVTIKVIYNQQNK